MIFFDISQKNVEDRSKLNAEERAKNPPKYIQADGPFAYNYSIQSLNSTELALNKLRNQLAQVNILVFAYLKILLIRNFCIVLTGF